MMLQVCSVYFYALPHLAWYSNGVNHKSAVCADKTADVDSQSRISTLLDTAKVGSVLL